MFHADDPQCIWCPVPPGEQWEAKVAALCCAIRDGQKDWKETSEYKDLAKECGEYRTYPLAEFRQFTFALIEYFNCIELHRALIVGFRSHIHERGRISAALGNWSFYKEVTGERPPSYRRRNRRPANLCQQILGRTLPYNEKRLESGLPLPFGEKRQYRPQNSAYAYLSRDAETRIKPFVRGFAVLVAFERANAGNAIVHSILALIPGIVKLSGF